MKTPALLLTSLVLALFGFASPARAATVITTGTDAELRAAVAGCGPITFNFDGVITLTNAIDVTCAVTIDATGHAVTISGGNSNRIFNVLPGASLEIVNLTVANGWVRGTNGLPGTPATFGSLPGQSVAAGGVFVTNASLIASGCVFINCRAIGGNGGDWLPSNIQYSAGAGGVGSGGAIAARNSSVTLQNCFFTSNSTTAGFRGVAFRQNGGVFSPATIGEAFGGAIDAEGGTLVSTNCQFSLNLTTTRGCALSLKSQANATIHQSTFTANGSGVSGGAIYFAGNTLAVTHTAFLNNNSATYGGALHVAGGTADFTDCSFAGNQCRGPGSGGAHAQTLGSSSFSRCTFWENAASTEGGAAVCVNGSLWMTNCTLALNSLLPGATTAGRGAAIAALGGIQFLDSCTIASNRITGGSASSQGGGLYVTIGYFDVLNSLLQGNTVNGNPSNSFGGNVADNGHNLSSDSTPTWASGSSFNSVNAQLLPLAANGGPTLTMALRANSPALNAADPEYFPAADQRGFARPQGAGPDVGAWEGAGGQVDLQIGLPPTFSFNPPASALAKISWLTDTGVTYRLERATTLTNWGVLATNLPGTGGRVTYSYNVTNGPIGSFRVATEP